MLGKDSGANPDTSTNPEKKMAIITVPNRMFPEFLTTTKRTIFRIGVVTVPLGQHTFISENPVTQKQFDQWAATGRPTEEINGELFIKQDIVVTKIVIQEANDFTVEEIRLNDYETKLEALEDLKQRDPSFNAHSALSLFYYAVVRP
jgi:hypothetical protein